MIEYMSSSSPFRASHLTWPFRRDSQRFRVRVVEPADYSTPDSADILFAVLKELIEPDTRMLDHLDGPSRHVAAQRFDLITFPEAFATPASVVSVADALSRQGSTGCLHIGLKSERSIVTHLMAPSEITALVRAFDDLADPKLGDLNDFRDWLADQHHDHRFNIGCVLAVDADGRLRVCLHPKIVASRFEIDVLSERNMQEADLLTLITLRPSSGPFVTITLQPLICSDTLNLPTERMTGPPMAAITQHAECFDAVPDHVDLVSVATCTPQPRGNVDTESYAEWHNSFLDAFLAGANSPSCRRHSFASIVLANYGSIRGQAAGLSGAFVPKKAGFKELHGEVLVSGFGKKRKGGTANNVWSTPSTRLPDDFSDLGFLFCLDVEERQSAEVARVMGFSLHHLPREAAPWGSSTSSVVEPNVMKFERRDDGRIERVQARGRDV